MYAQLKEIDVSKCESPIQVHYRSCADGKQRRINTGNSSSSSTFPIPDAPEHTKLLGNMLVIYPGPVCTVEDTREMEKNWMKEKTPVPRSELARNNFGNEGRVNLTNCDMQDYFPGAMHLAIRSAETLSVQIGMCAIGKLAQTA